ncbi:hypothetical protein [Streptomyces sp. 1222.5]|uniref:hypothetical protein n=1 Tax=Streptomyces sp. 1222.5 TaxID=1881026 RepID=UPI003D751E9D
MIAAAADPWWADWPKFLPGWFAFTWTLSLAARNVWLRRHHLALGPEAEELRTQLTATRMLIEEVISAGPRADWFTHDDRRETARALRDAAARRDDPALKLTLTRLADTWDEIFALAPPPAPPRVRWLDGGSEETHKRREIALRETADLERLQKMADRAREAQIDVQTALARLNELERRTLGRS